MANAQSALLRALANAAEAEPAIIAERLTGWSSATFVGARHRLILRMPAAAARRLAKAVGAEAVHPAGHLIVELGVRWRPDSLVEIAATTVEEA